MAQGGGALASLLDYSSSEDEEVKPPPPKKRKKAPPKARSQKKFSLPSATDVMSSSGTSAEFIEEHRKKERRKVQQEIAKSQALEVQTVKAILSDRKKIAEKQETVNTILEERRLRDEAVAVAAVKSRMEEKAKAEENALSQAERDARSAFSLKNAKQKSPRDSEGIADDLSKEYEDETPEEAVSPSDSAATKKKKTRKEMEKAKRMRGQSSIDGWKSETYMKVRQEFD